MKKRLVAFAATMTALTIPGLMQAHHSFLAYEFEPMWVQGTVVSFERSNPHTFTTLETGRDDGRIQRWRVEGPPISRLDRVADLYFPEVGDVIRVCALPYKPIEELQRLWPEVDFSASRNFRTQESDGAVTQTVDGYIMVRPDGDLQVWDSIALLTRCMQRSDDAPEFWLGIINGEWRQAWCRQRQRNDENEPDPTLQAYIEEMNVLLENPCE